VKAILFSKRRSLTIVIISPAVLALIVLLGGASMSYATWSSIADRSALENWKSTGLVVWQVPVPTKVIALTFDDGPDPAITPAILNTLEQYHVRATFFMVGKNVAEHPDVARAVAAAGHEIANHTYTHPSMSRISPERLEKEMMDTEQIIYAVTGKRTRLFRPPSGRYNATVVQTAERLGYRVILWTWNQDTRDWANPGVQNIVHKVVEHARPGSIVLCHDRGSRCLNTAKALPTIIKELRTRGYRFATVSELLNSKGVPPRSGDNADVGN